MYMLLALLSSYAYDDNDDDDADDDYGDGDTKIINKMYETSF